MSRLSTVVFVSPLLLAPTACGDNAREHLPWGIGVATFEARTLGITGADAPPAPPWFAVLSDTPHVATPTYDGSDQATHPDLLAEDDRALLALTPYPFSRDRFENPSLLVAPDGVTFAPFPGAPSPLVEAPPTDHNDDPDLHRDPATGEYELLYLDTERPDRQTLAALRSRDLVAWTRRDAIVWDLAAGDEFVVSPAAVVDHANLTHVFWVNTVSNAIETVVSTDGTTWDKTTARPIELPATAMTPWHVDAFRAGDGFALLISGYVADGDGFDHQDVFLALSPDLATWSAPTLLLSHTDLDLATLYRSTGVVAGGRLAVWYAMQYAP